MRDLIACYGATVATITAIFQIANYLRDRKKVLVTYQKNMRPVNISRLDITKKYTYVKVVNVGRRPLTLRTIGLRLLKGGGAVFADIYPPLPCQLTEGTFARAVVTESELIFDDIHSFEAEDAGSTIYRVNVAPIQKRFLWFIKRSIFTQSPDTN